MKKEKSLKDVVAATAEAYRLLGQLEGIKLIQLESEMRAWDGIAALIEKGKTNISEIAKAIGISRQEIYRKMAKRPAMKAALDEQKKKMGLF